LLKYGAYAFLDDEDEEKNPKNMQIDELLDHNKKHSDKKNKAYTL
jgi:hypothetical protein